MRNRVFGNAPVHPKPQCHLQILKQHRAKRSPVRHALVLEPRLQRFHAGGDPAFRGRSHYREAMLHGLSGHMGLASVSPRNLRIREKR